MVDRRVRLLLAAFPPELAGLDVAPPEGWIVAPVGIGAVVAAVETSRLVALHAPERVLFVGTCGAYDARLAIGDIIAASVAVACSVEEREGRSYRPAQERTEWPSSWQLPLPHHRVVVPPAITTADTAARVLAACGAAEHLELTGVFAACHAARVPAAAALAVANRVGPEAHAEWRAHHGDASRALIAELIRLRVLEPASRGA